MAINEQVERIIFEGVDKISATTKSAETGIKQLMQTINGVKDVLGALGVTVGAGAFIRLQLDALHATAALDDMAEATGASVENLSAIQRVAKVGGQDFDGLTQQIGRMVKGLKDNSEEGNKTATALGVLGLRARDQNGQWRDTGQVLIEVAQKLSKYQDGAGKVALIQNVLGKGAERYLPLLKDMAEGTDLHATTTGRQAAKAEEAEKAINRLKLVMEDARRETVVNLTPAITRLVEQMTTGIEKAGGFGQALKLGLIDPGPSIEENIAKTQKAIEDWRNAGPLGKFMQKPLGSKYSETEGDLQKRLDFLKFQRRQQMDATAQDPQSPLFQFEGGGIVQQKALNYSSPDLAKEKATRDLIAKQEEESAQEQARIQSEAADVSDKFRANERVQLQKWHALGLGDDADYYKSGGAMLITANEYRIQALMEAGEREQDEAYARGHALLEADSTNYTTKLQLLHEQFGAAAQLENEAHERHLEQLNQFSDEELELLGGRQALIEQATQEHQLRLNEIQRQAIRTRSEWERAGAAQRISTVFGEIAEVTAGVAQRNRTLFEINKVAAISNAIISTYEGVSKTLGTYPWPLAGVMAAIHLAAGLARVAAIQSTGFGAGGGGGGAAPSVAGTTPAPAVSPVDATTAASQAAQRTVIVKIVSDGTLFTIGQVRQLAEAIADQTEGGVVIS